MGDVINLAVFRAHQYRKAEEEAHAMNDWADEEHRKLAIERERIMEDARQEQRELEEWGNL